MADSLIKASSGASAQAFTTLMLFPLDKIKTLLQVSTKSEGALSVARRIVAANGALALWWGMGAKLQQAVYSKFTFFYIFSAISSRVTAMLGGQVGTFASLAVGYVAALLNTGLTLPVEVATNIIMANKGGRGADGRLPAERSLAETMRAVHAEKGVAGLYSGGGVITLGLCLNPALEFGLIERFKAPVLARQLARGVRRPALSVAQSFLFGALSKIVATLVTFPLIRAKVLIQTAGKAAAKTSGEAASNDDDDDDDDDDAALRGDVFGVLSRVVRKEGMAGLYKGVQPQLTKGVLSSALMLTFREKIDRIVRGALVALLKSKQQQKAAAVAAK